MTGHPLEPLRFPRSMRLKQAREFNRIRTQGQRVVKGCVIANWMELPEGSTSRLGVITPRKLGNAVRRARARRLLRESFRLHQHHFRQPVALVLVARPSLAGKGFAEVERDLLSALKQAKLLKNE